MKYVISIGDKYVLFLNHHIQEDGFLNLVDSQAKATLFDDESQAIAKMSKHEMGDFEYEIQSVEILTQKAISCVVLESEDEGLGLSFQGPNPEQRDFFPYVESSGCQSFSNVSG